MRRCHFFFLIASLFLATAGAVRLGSTAALESESDSGRFLKDFGDVNIDDGGIETAHVFKVLNPRSAKGEPRDVLHALSSEDGEIESEFTAWSELERSLDQSRPNRYIGKLAVNLTDWNPLTTKWITVQAGQASAVIRMFGCCVE